MQKKKGGGGGRVQKELLLLAQLVNEIKDIGQGYSNLAREAGCRV